MTVKMKKLNLGKSNILVAPLAFGGNVFGWTIDEKTSFQMLDAFVDRGFNLIDTADAYSRWVTGNKGGESETIIGRWLKKSNKRNKVVIATKVGLEMGPGLKGLGRQHIRHSVEASLQRLQIDCIDLYQSHVDDPETEISETLQTYTELIREGKIRAIGASNFSGARLKASQDLSRQNSWAEYCSLQPRYNLYDRQEFETQLAPVCKDYGIAVINFYPLASGFLSGKYRSEKDLSKSVRGPSRIKEAYLNEKGLKILAAMDRVSEMTGAPLASIALAWLFAIPVITAPIFSATRLEQIDEVVSALDLKLSKEALDVLNTASAY